MTRRFALGLAAAVTMALVMSLAALDWAGRASRSTPTSASVIVVDDSRDLLDTWRSRGVHGAIVVDATRDLGYLPINEDVLRGEGSWQGGWPIVDVDLQGAYARAAERPSIMWVAARVGIARSVTYVLPPPVFADRVRDGRDKGFPGIAPDGRSITANDEGYLRLILDRFPEHADATHVLNVDASYFVEGSPEALLAALGDSTRSYGLITVNRSMDATDIPAAARTRAEQAAGMLRERVAP